MSIATTSDAPGGLCGLHRAQPHRPHAEDRRGLPLRQRPRVDRVEARPHHVAREQGDLVGEPLRHLAQGEVGVRHQHLLGLGALQRAERRPVAVDAGLVALVELLAPAEEALAAGGRVGAEHPIPDGDARHLVARGDHLADELVADHESGLDLHAAVVDVEVRAADPARLDADDRVVRGEQLGLGDFVHPDLAGRLEGHGAHAWSLCEKSRGPPRFERVSGLPRKERVRWGSRRRGRC